MAGRVSRLLNMKKQLQSGLQFVHPLCHSVHERYLSVGNVQLLVDRATEMMDQEDVVAIPMAVKYMAEVILRATEPEEFRILVPF